MNHGCCPAPLCSNDRCEGECGTCSPGPSAPFRAMKADAAGRQVDATPPATTGGRGGFSPTSPITRELRAIESTRARTARKARAVTPAIVKRGAVERRTVALTVERGGPQGEDVPFEVTISTSKVTPVKRPPRVERMFQDAAKFRSVRGI